VKGIAFSNSFNDSSSLNCKGNHDGDRVWISDLKEAGNSFQQLPDRYTSEDEYYHCLTSDATIIMVSRKCPIIGKQVALILFTLQVTIATIQPVKTPLILALRTFNLMIA